MLPIFVILVSLFILAVAAYTDMKTLEVPDWLNYAGIAAGLGIGLILSLEQWNYWPFASSVIGLAIGFGLACIMFYTAQWGGGDAKLLMAMGALIGFDANKFGFGSSFLINLVFVGGVWVFAYGIVLALLSGKRLWKTCLALARQKQYARIHRLALVTALAIALCAVFVPELRFEILGLAALCYLLASLTIFMKSIELVAMHKWVTPEVLTEGDWLVHAVRIGKKTIEPPRLGLESAEVRLLKEWHRQGKVDKVLVRYGVPFTPAFLFAFILTLALGNVMFNFFVHVLA